MKLKQKTLLKNIFQQEIYLKDTMKNIKLIVSPFLLVPNVMANTVQQMKNFVI